MSNSQDDFAVEMQEMLSLLTPLEVEAAATDSSRYVVAEYILSEADEKAEIKKSLIRQITVEEAETVGWPKGSFTKEGFKWLPDDPGWKAFKAQMQDGDELWTSSTVECYLGFCAGGEGYVIMRNGEVIEQLVTCIIG